MSTIAIMQPYIFPYIGYFQLINAVDKFVLFDDVNFIKRGWINRNNLLLNGKSHLFSIPLKEASQNKLINEIELSPEVKWKNNFLKTVEQYYKNAPQFEVIYTMVTEIINYEEVKLNLYLLNSLNKLANYLSLQTDIVASSSIYNNKHIKGAERIVNVCSQENASTYINPIGGMDIYSKDFFAERNIRLQFLKSKSIRYQQFRNDFIPWLSIIDVLMFNDKQEIANLLNQYELI